MRPAAIRAFRRTLVSFIVAAFPTVDPAPESHIQSQSNVSRRLRKLRQRSANVNQLNLNPVQSILRQSVSSRLLGAPCGQVDFSAVETNNETASRWTNHRRSMGLLRGWRHALSMMDRGSLLALNRFSEYRSCPTTGILSSNEPPAIPSDDAGGESALPLRAAFSGAHWQRHLFAGAPARDF